MSGNTQRISESLGKTYHDLKIGLPCENCGEVVEQRYCSACGQLAADYHRPLPGLIAASLSDSLALDGRLGRTLREMFLKPGQMTRSYLDGQRARYVPPFRLYIFASLIFFFAVFSSRGGARNVELDQASLSPPDAQEEVIFGDEVDPGVDLSEAFDESGKLDSEKLSDIFMRDAVDENMPVEDRERIENFSNRLSNAYNDQDSFIRLMKSYAPRASILMVPLLAAMLAILYINKRGPMLFEHLITALHFQVFVYLAGTIFILIGSLYAPLGGLAWVLIWPYLFFYLYRTQRRVYAGSRWLTVARTSLLSVVMLVFFIMMVFGIAATALMTL